MKKMLISILILMGLSVGASAWNLIEPVSDSYYDATAEGKLKPLRNCSYTVSFEYFGRAVTVYGKKVHRRIMTDKPESIVIDRIVLNEKDHYDGYHIEDHYEYFLQEVPKDGYMELVYTFVDRTGNIYQRSEKIYKPKSQQLFPTWSAIPKECKTGKMGNIVDRVRGKYRSFRSR